MKITVNQLRKIIKEEVQKVVKESMGECPRCTDRLHKTKMGDDICTNCGYSSAPQEEVTPADRETTSRRMASLASLEQ
jgi:uncharacterized Zn finger protein (UPF0148 family)